MRQDELLYLNAELSSADRRAVQRRIVAGELNRVRAGIATPLAEDEWPALFKREKVRVLAAAFPDAVVSYRSAFDGMAGSTIYLVAGYRRTVDLPGLTVVVSKGPGQIEGDSVLGGRPLYFASPERMLLEATAPPRSTNPTPAYPREVSAAEVEERLISICDSRGEQNFAQMRSRLYRTGQLLGTPKKRLDDLDRHFGAILGTRPDRVMTTPQGTGRARGYDAARMDLFHALVRALKVKPLPQIAAIGKSGSAAASSLARRNLAFLESYFSNFIEGTEFEIGEARSIVFEGRTIEARPKDAHDILGVFHQANDKAWRSRGIADLNALEATLRERHALMMAGRPEVLPGELKVVRNVAGTTNFVEPKLVVGTLREAGLLMHDVERGLPRALLAMFIVSEVHPFNDGNGRLARLVMNSELSAAGEMRVVVPTLYREEYLDCLRELTREQRTGPYITAMTNIQAWTAAFDYENLDATIRLMRQCNAFERSLAKYKLLRPEQMDQPNAIDHALEGDDVDRSTVPRG